MNRRLITWMLFAVLAAAGPVVAAELSVVASIKPVHSLVAGVMAGRGETVLLASGSSSPHGAQLRPSDARHLVDADLVFWIGPSLEAFLVKPLEALAAEARLVTLADAPGLQLLASGEGGLRSDDDALIKSGDAKLGHGDEDDHERGPIDMHLWLDPDNAALMVEAVVQALSAKDPSGAAHYAANGARVRSELMALGTELERSLKPLADRPFVVFHDAYRYFERRFKLQVLASLSVDPQRRPGARRLAAIQDALLRSGAACVFAEPQFEPSIIATVIEGTTARIGVLDPLGAELQPGPDLYPSLMRALVDSLSDCLSKDATP